ncbi:MAG: MGMT family protein [Kiritimatiellaeota bacterium]|nr:MGMT family protein [Kiritimatiellota bacterium]
MAKKTWSEKLNNGRTPEVKEVPPEAAAAMGGARMLVATPLCYDALMKCVPRGKVITTDRINAYLAKKHNADWTCPLTAGIFVNIAANASAERRGENETPYWRTLKKGGELNEKFPGGIDGHQHLLEKEGHKVFQKGKRSFVSDFEKVLHELKSR